MTAYDLQVDERPLADAAKAALSVALGEHDAYFYGEVPGADGNTGTLPDIYAVVSVERLTNPLRRSTAQTGRGLWLIDARGVGRTVNEARWAMAKIAAALNEKRITVPLGTQPGDGTVSTSVIQFRSSQQVGKDDGRFSGRSEWTCTTEPHRP